MAAEESIKTYRTLDEKKIIEAAFVDAEYFTHYVDKGYIDSDEEEEILYDENEDFFYDLEETLRPKNVKKGFIDITCPICLEISHTAKVLPCNKDHWMCTECFTKKGPICPECGKCSDSSEVEDADLKEKQNSLLTTAVLKKYVNPIQKLLEVGANANTW